MLYAAVSSCMVGLKWSYRYKWLNNIRTSWFYVYKQQIVLYYAVNINGISPLSLLSFKTIHSRKEQTTWKLKNTNHNGISFNVTNT